MRAAPEQLMIADIHCMIAAGQDLDWIDAQGATLVSGGAGLGEGGAVSTGTKTSCGQSGPAPGGGQMNTVGSCPWP